MKNLLKLLSLFFIAQMAAQKYEGLAPTPPMGWNSWNTFEVSINENLVKETADLLVSTGMKDAGYEYIVLDDGWMVKDRRDENGNLIPDPAKFPGGMKALIDYVHSKGLKFGLYNCAGTQTCAGYPGTRGFEYQDARFYADLGIDFLKYDWCNTEGINAKEAYTTMSKALKTAGKPIVFSICEWGDNQPWTWAGPVGNLWRVSGDIYPCFDCEYKHPEGNWSSWGVLKILEMRTDIRKFSGPDHWNDFDMMEVGNGMTATEDKSHFTLWSMMASPLFAGNDLRLATPETLKILTNREIIEINQDPIGIQGFKYQSDGVNDVWVKPLTDNNWAVVFLNRSDKPAKLKFDWNKHIIVDKDFNRTLDLTNDSYALRDLWQHRDDGNTNKKLNVNLAAHDVIAFKLKKLN
ncbi:glycoside hydrolase family 27 protein [Kaistella sp. 97-N-M2]|uniref:glycoside hydrolase family 27 protein n=1 Tax=Kaistella sp. 97-N-M2 TaxID=2908645 RepID=UPI001F410C56|nr:glycoside hydrolase family 27 protein [Kaistella sp. 97-N-M2]UJF29594.1 glycoside hydrolase family 27 protein [Kaistella sp. 97-N-M2]